MKFRATYEKFFEDDTVEIFEHIGLRKFHPDDIDTPEAEESIDQVVEKFQSKYGCIDSAGEEFDFIELEDKKKLTGLEIILTLKEFVEAMESKVLKDK